MEKQNNTFENTFNYKVIYVFRIHDEAHKNVLKIGESTLKTNLNVEELTDNSDLLNNSAKKRIKQYTNTIGVQEELLYTTLAIDSKNKIFKDQNVHKVLKNSGIEKYDFKNEKNPEEWFEINLETAINAINAVKEGKKSLTRSEISESHEDIIFRPEQLDAINQTLKRFETGDRMLWNAKMRFGKTLSTLEVIKRMAQSDKFNLKNAIILTHRPVVDKGWFEDFTKIFYNSDEFLYGSKNKSTIDELLKSGHKYIYFASIQDLRGSDRVGGKFNKNDKVFNINWDLVVVDEAHEGTQTELGEAVLKEIIQNSNGDTKQLYLSGTPFNLLSDFESKDIYTWDYIMEQKAKYDWEKNHSLEPNPYDELPRLNIYTYNLNEYLPLYIDVADGAFNFREFFRVWTGETEKDGKEVPSNDLIGKFMHEEDVETFLNLLTKQDENSHYPFSRKEYIDNFRHTFWILPGVKEAKALKELMLKNPIFQQFNIVNVAGTGDANGNEAIELVEKAIGEDPNDTYTITLSCGKLTTGVTVKPWTAVLYLSGSFSTSASSYLQTIFRVQSPANFGGKQKTDCFVFDFAPDRTLKMVASAGSLSVKAGSTGGRETMKQFLNYCPVISVDGSSMVPYKVETMLEQLKKAYVERVVDNGFDDSKIYNDNLLKLNDIDLEKFENLKGIIGSTKQSKKIEEIDINNQGFTDEQWVEVEKAKKKPKSELTEEQKKLLDEIKEKNKQKQTAISILRGISIRIPLLIYGANIKDGEDVTIENFTEIVDDVSWEEFMPKGVTKEMFKDFSKFYDSEIFIGAGRRIRNVARHADTLNPIERAITISNLFSTFRNPDKETVLTPWRTVNMHLGNTLGGYNFYDDKYLVTIEEPRLINNGQITHDVLFNTDAKILELNSKTGLYPLYITISLFKQKCLNTDAKKLTEEMEKYLWDDTLKNNIYVVCKTPMAKSITKRTLLGFRDSDINVINLENITELISDDSDKFENILLDSKTWSKEGSERMKFNAIVGNPPYQENVGDINTNASLSKQLYPLFIKGAIKLNSNYVSLITPSRWFTGNGQDGSFPKLRDFVKENNHIEKIFNYPNANDVFNNVNIAGGVNYFVFNKNYVGNVEFSEINGENIIMSKRPLFEDGVDIIIPMNSMIGIMRKVTSYNNFKSLEDITTGRNPFGVPITDKELDKFLSNEKNQQHQIKIFGAHEKISYIDETIISKGKDLMNQWKIFISKANGGAGLLSDDKTVAILGKPFLAEPNSICSNTLIAIGSFETKEEAQNLQKYICTKFLRFLVGIMKTSQNLTSNVYKFVPVENFTANSDIDWSKSIDEIDIQLFNKYNLSEEEINYINQKITKVSI